MPEFRRGNNGYVSAHLGDGELDAMFKNLKYLRQDAYQDFELIMKGDVTIETLREVKAMTGTSFAGWMEVNFDNGKGPLAELIRDIIHYLNGRCGHRQLITSLGIQENKLVDANSTRYGTYTPTTRTGGHAAFLQDGDTVYDNDLFRLMAGVGAGVVGRIFLLLGGESYYGSN
jgi:hypothetical protein